jgi:serine/threonine protein kinase
VRAKVADFGMARIAAPTLSGALDTWQWLAPEVIGSSQEYGSQADVYSFGIVCWEIATRGYPFDEYATDPKYCVPNKAAARVPSSAEDEANGAPVVPELEFDPLKIKRDIIEQGLRPSLPDESEECPSGFASLIADCWQAIPAKRPTFLQAVNELQKLTAAYPVQLNSDEEPVIEEDDSIAQVSTAIITPDWTQTNKRAISAADTFNYKTEAELESKKFSIGAPVLCCAQPLVERTWFGLQTNTLLIMALTVCRGHDVLVQYYHWSANDTECILSVLIVAGT